MQKLLNILLISSAFIILGVTLFSYVQQHPNKQEDTILHQERVGVVGGEKESEEDASHDRQVDKTSPTQRGQFGKGFASWYGKEVCGKRIYGETCKTASGEIFNETKLTFASRFMEFGTRVEFCYSGSCVVCRRTDYGPAVWTNRTFDLSRACFNGLADLSKGVITVSWRKVGE